MFSQEVFLIDSANLIHRHFYAAPLLQAPNGQPTNAIRGWIKTILNLQETYQPKQIVAVFESGGCPKRKALIPEYKSNRSKKEPELVLQYFQILHEYCPMMGIATIKMGGYEADDILGALGKKQPSVLLSGDKDLAQCITKTCHLMRPGKQTTWERYHLQNAKSLLGVEPNQIPDYLAIVGDSVDCITGLPGAGPKTATKWLEEWGSLQGILQNRSKIKPARFQKLLTEHEAQLHRNFQATQLLKAEVELPEAPTTQPEQLLKIAADLRIKSLLDPLQKWAGQQK